MCLITASLMAFRSALKIGELSPEFAGLLIGGAAVFFALWIAAERLGALLPGLCFCNVCGERLKHLEVIRNFRTARGMSYPFRLPDGSRTELSVKALCPRCARRARKHRRTEAPEE